VGCSDHHDRRAPEQMDVHALDARAAQAGDHLGPDALMVLAVRGDGRRIVAEMDQKHVSRHAESTTFWHDSPNPSMPSATISPAFRYTGAGFMPRPTPGGVPVLITSP